MDILKQFEELVKNNPKRIVLPEGEEIRTLKAAHNLLQNGLVSQLFLLGNPTTINQLASQEDLDLSQAIIIHPEASPLLQEYTQHYYELRKDKGMTLEQALTFMKDPIYYGAMMMAKSVVDGNVAGCVTSTATVLKAAITIVKPDPELKSVSSFFMMVHDNPNFGHNGVMLFADCAVVPQPDAQSLAQIAIAAAANAKKLLQVEAKIAMLSFSTKGSAKHDDTNKVLQALEIVKKQRPDLKIDGEMQFDAALIESIGQRKAPGSEIAGRANVFIFPDLDAANIGYKIAERLGGAKAIGPILQGLNKPCNDLSRGASPEDIYNTVIITSLQS